MAMFAAIQLAYADEFLTDTSESHPLFTPTAFSLSAQGCESASYPGILDHPPLFKQPHDAVDALVDAQSPEVLFAPHIHELSALWF